MGVNNRLANNDYVADYLCHDAIATRANHKYIARIIDGGKPKYFYTQEELSAYKNGGQTGNASQQSGSTRITNAVASAKFKVGTKMAAAGASDYAKRNFITKGNAARNAIDKMAIKTGTRLATSAVKTRAVNAIAPQRTIGDRVKTTAAIAGVKTGAKLAKTIGPTAAKLAMRYEAKKIQNNIQKKIHPENNESTGLSGNINAAKNAASDKFSAAKNATSDKFSAAKNAASDAFGNAKKAAQDFASDPSGSAKKAIADKAYEKYRSTESKVAKKYAKKNDVTNAVDDIASSGSLAAFEMRRRGYDVDATNESKGMNTKDIFKNGQPISIYDQAKYIGSDGNTYVDSDRISDVIKGGKELHGQRGALTIDTDSGKSVEVAYEVDRLGKVHYYDANKGEERSGIEMNFLLTHAKDTKLMRTDNLDVDEHAGRHFKNRKKN